MRWQIEGTYSPCSTVQWCAGITELWSLCSPACARGQHNCRYLWQYRWDSCKGDWGIQGSLEEVSQGTSCWTEPASPAMQIECQENTSLVRASTCNAVCGSDRGPVTYSFGSGSWSGAGNSGLVWFECSQTGPFQLLSSAVLQSPRQGWHSPGCACARARKGVGLMGPWAAGRVMWWLQAGQHQPAVYTTLRIQPHPKEWGMFPLYPPKAK